MKTDKMTAWVALPLAGLLALAGCSTGGMVGSGGTGSNISNDQDSRAKLGNRQIGVEKLEPIGYAIATDVGGNVYVAGFTYGSLDGNPMAGTRDAFLTKYDGNGARLYTRQMGVPGAITYGSSVAVDMDGNVYMVGNTRGSLDGNLLKGTRDAFFTKYDRNGVRQYTRQFGARGAMTYGRSITTDADGNVFVAGYTYGGLDGNAQMGLSDFFVTRYDRNGVRQYTRQLGVTGAITFGQSVATDGDGNVYVTGYTFGGLDGNALTGFADGFVTKYDRDGNRQYTRLLGADSAGTYATSVATDADGNVYVAGRTEGGLDGNTVTGTTDFFVTKYDRNGAKQHTRQLGVSGKGTYAAGLATGPGGSVYVTGLTSGALDGNPLTGTVDLFVTRYDHGSARQDTRQFGLAGANTVGVSVTTDARGNAYVAGYTHGGEDGSPLTGSRKYFVIRYDGNDVKHLSQF